MFNHIVRKLEFHGRTLTIETGKIARQAGGAVTVRYGDTVVLVTACSGADKQGDFFPLTVDYVEKNYAAGKIPGGFFKREGRLSEKETLISRLIDRPCRPLFPDGYTTEVQVIVTVLSADEENDADMLAVLGASSALTLSDLPFEGPMAAVRVGRIKGEFVINPKTSELKNCDLNFVVAGTRDAIVMVEGGADEVAEEVVLEALFYAHKSLQVLVDEQLELQKLAGKPKIVVAPAVESPLADKVHAFITPLLKEGAKIAKKHERSAAFKVAKDAMKKEFIKEGAEDAVMLEKEIVKIFEDKLYEVVRSLTFDTGLRLDGRDTKTVRPIAVETGILPRVHGSSLFTRGETQAIVAVTLGTEQEAQKLDNLVGDTTKTFMLHYNFPPFSVGETRPMRGPGRREVGHGALAERAVKAVMPSVKDFPYVVRVVSEITESNGSSSMASVCGASLALMEAGVPLKAPVAGVAMGLMKEGAKTAILTDILGDEDHLGDMDFKVCGTAKGITALQMDIKIKGLDKETLSAALTQAKDGRLHILSKMNEVLSTHKAGLSQYAPKIVTMKINPEKIRDVIGSGGKTIRSICESCDVKLEVSDDGTVSISSNDEAKIKKAIAIVESLTVEAVIGKIYKGIVKRVADFGAFVEILPGTDGLVHISQLAENKVGRVTDVVREGDEVSVKVLEIDRQGKIRLSLKDAVKELQGAA